MWRWRRGGVGLRSRCGCAELYGLELQPELVELARSNAAGPASRSIFNKDLLDPPAPIAAGGFTPLWQSALLPLERAIWDRLRESEIAYRRRRATLPLD